MALEIALLIWGYQKSILRY